MLLFFSFFPCFILECQTKANEIISITKGKKPTMRPSKEMLLSHHRRDLLQSKSLLNQLIPHANIITLTYTPCTEPLTSLQRISFNELVLETVHRGKYVLFKTLAEAFKEVGVRTVVEDPEGNAEMFSIYNYALNKTPFDVLPTGVIIAVKEPYYKTSASGGAILRCDHPQNIIYLKINDPVVRQFEWKSGLPNAADGEEILSIESIRLQGNQFFKELKFYDAVTTYTRGLTSVSSNSDLTVLRLNRAAALLKLEYYEAALEDCRYVLELDGQNEKALYRAAKAFYGLEQYEQALVKMQLYAHATRNKVEAEYEIKIIRDRLKEEQHGIYDWNAMVHEANKSSTPRLNHATYIGPVRVANISNERGRGLILTKDVRKGELLLCSKAFEACYPSEAEPVTYINMETKRDDAPTQGMLTRKILHKLINNPSLVKSFFDLYAGKNRLNKIPSIVSTPPIVDIFWISDICSMNTFGRLNVDLIPSLQQKITAQSNQLTEDESCAVFLMPSYINHACLGNCVRSFIGDMMIVRALDDLTAGTELLMTYIDIFSDIDERQLTICKHQFICKCTLCELDETESRDIRNRRNTAFQMFQNEIFLKMTQGLVIHPQATVKVAEEIIDKIEKTYNETNRKELKIRMCPQLMFLAKLYTSIGNLDKSIQTCMKILKLHGYGTKKGTWTVCLFPAMTQLSLMYYSTRNTQMGHLWLEKLRAELSITATGDDRLFLQEYRVVFAQVDVKL